MKGNISLLWFGMFGKIGVKVKCDDQIFLLGADSFELFQEQVESVTEKRCDEFYFVDGDGDKINIKDEVSFSYFIETWNMETTLNIFLAKYIQKSS